MKKQKIRVIMLTKISRFAKSEFFRELGKYAKNSRYSRNTKSKCGQIHPERTR